MRVLQLVDSLEAGGTERMAVNLANLLALHIDKSYLCASRSEGVLRNELNDEVVFKCLNRRNTFDIMAMMALRKWVTHNRIDLIHAHASSFFLAVMMKIAKPKLQLVWHDHNGQRHQTPWWYRQIIRYSSWFFDATIVVNEALKDWAQSHLLTKNIKLLPNFVIAPKNTLSVEKSLAGHHGFRIVCIANIRRVKDQQTLIKAFSEVLKLAPKATLHLVGDFQSVTYKKELDSSITSLKLSETVFFYGQQSKVSNFITQANVCVISSVQEGLPLVLLEYGLLKKAVVSTEVGDIPKLIDDTRSGYLVAPGDHRTMAKRILDILQAPEQAVTLGMALYKEVDRIYSAPKVLEQLLKIYSHAAN